MKCKEIRQAIQKKVNEIIQKIKDEEAKLLDDVDDFERTETSLLNDKNMRLSELEAMNKFSSVSNNILTRSRKLIMILIKFFKFLHHPFSKLFTKLNF